MYSTLCTMPRMAGRVFVVHGLVHAADAQGVERGLVVFLTVDAALDLRDLQHAVTLRSRRRPVRRPERPSRPGPCRGPRGRSCHAGERCPRDAAGERSPCFGRPHHVDGVGGAQALGEDVVDAAQFQQRAHAATGDDAGTGGSRAQAAPGRRRSGPSTSWVMVVPCLGTTNRFLRASSMAFWMASGTSLALP